MLHRYAFSNFQSFRERTEVSWLLDGRVPDAVWSGQASTGERVSTVMAVIGPNASGKSNLLEVFRFLHDLTTEGGGLAKAVSLREGMSKLRSLHATVNSAVDLEVGIEDREGAKWVYRLAFDTVTGTSPEPVVKEELVTKNGQVLLQRPTADDQKDRERLRQTAIEQVSANKGFRTIAEFFRSIRFMNLVPQLIREGQTSPQVFPGQDPLGRDLLEQIRQPPRDSRPSV